MKRRLVLKADVRREYAKQRAEGHTAKTALSIARHYCKMRASPFYNVSDGERVTYKGREYLARSERDDYGSVPWKDCDPLGPVAQHTGEDSRLPSGWVWIDGAPTRRAYGYAYNRAAAIAAVQAWGDTRERAEYLADSEIARFRDWLRDGWCYLSVGVQAGKEQEWLGGVESDCPEHIAEMMEEMADTLAERIEDDKRREMLRRAFC